MMGVLPPLGAFIRPIGMTRYGYCLRVVRQFTDDDGQPAIEYERWGMRDGRPVDDDHILREYYIDLVPCLIPGLWRYPPAQPDDWCDRDSYRYATPSYQIWETYYRLMSVDQHGQRELFA